MDHLLTAAGFPGVEVDDGVIHARLSASGAAFMVVPEGDGWRFSLCWPVRATEAQRAVFAAAHPGAVVDILKGETRLSMMVDNLAVWGAVAEAFVIAAVGWRRAQRAPGEGN